MRLRVVAAALLLAAAAAWIAPRGRAADEKPAAPKNGSCAVCHTGIEEMHPWSPVTCVQCHGGNADAAAKEQAHVVAGRRAPGDERVLPLGFEPEATRFRDPGDPRVAAQTCVAAPCSMLLSASGPSAAKSADTIGFMWRWSFVRITPG